MTSYCTLCCSMISSKNSETAPFRRTADLIPRIHDVFWNAVIFMFFFMRLLRVKIRLTKKWINIRIAFPNIQDDLKWNMSKVLQTRGWSNTGSRPGAGLWRKSYRAVRNQGQIGPKLTGTSDIRNALRVPLITINPTGRCILSRQSKPRSLTELVPWWLTSCNKFACAKHFLFIEGLFAR